MEFKNFSETTEVAFSDGTAISIGNIETERHSVAEGLSRVLADTYALYLKTQNFHWNVSGPKFVSLHMLFEQQYKQLASAVDMIAERIRALGFWAPGSFSQFAEMTTVTEDQKVENADQMIRSLVHGHEAVIASLLKVCFLCEETHDVPTADLITQRMREHEKSTWMLRSLLN